MLGNALTKVVRDARVLLDDIDAHPSAATGVPAERTYAYRHGRLHETLRKLVTAAEREAGLGDWWDSTLPTPQHLFLPPTGRHLKVVDK